MSLIHQALKKAQIAQETDVLPVYGEEAKGRVYSNFPAARARIILIVFSSLIALFVGWWAIGRFGFLISHQTVSLPPFAKDFGAGMKQPNVPVAIKSSDKLVPEGFNRGIASSEQSRENSFQTAPEVARAKNMRGMELYKQGSFSLAKNEFLSSIEIFPQYAEAYNNLGLTYKQLGDIKAAEDSYKRAIQYKPDYPEAMNNYGVLLEAMGNSNAAKEYFKKAVLIAPDYPDPYLNMAISLEKDKRFEQAISYYEGFLSRMNPVRSSSVMNTFASNNNSVAREEASNGVKQGDDSLIKNVRERMLYLNANRFAVDKSR
ncbi:MAG: tetratricopeptide repeat protein [Deltaproteobacteria bacterium]|nr:tetratricopeptide repeat protein [Deltaproteobacteria bacterium]